jgi:predicted CoA-substrate-specific enzyme activase
MGRIGIDIGALFVKAVRTDHEGRIQQRLYERHRGQPAAALERALSTLDVKPGDRLAFTGSNAEALADALGAPYRDVTLCHVEAIQRLVPGVRYIIDIGGGSATLIELDTQGRFQGYATNSLCAAGTGSFLDEQAGRLGMSYAEAGKLTHCAEPPMIATRCTVFAKSDLIHRQQEGCTRTELWSGLCRGMTQTLIATLLHGRPLDGRTAVIGGVALNTEVVRWLDKAWPGLVVVPPEPHLVAVLGAASYAAPPTRLALPASTSCADGPRFARFPWPLSLKRSRYPSFVTEEAYEDENHNEIRVTTWPPGATLRAYLGVDIGSTSTKAVLIGEDATVIADIYRKTAGDPIGATQLLFRAIQALAERKAATLEILGLGTTGSGRGIVGSVIGADAVINEISAHVAGAAQVDQTIDTIFEIGGQDAKYMHLVDGHIRDASMNYVCAAGTGSFVEEQAIRLGYRVAEAGPKVLGIRPPRATDRCTVFMEQDMTKLVQAGASPEEAFAAVMVSVVKNYLNKVVGNRYRSRTRIFFQGATARNPALVAAFERLLDVEIVVSPYCHVMGAYGVALLARRLMVERGTPTAFRGLDVGARAVTLRKETCDLCHNSCTITHAEIAGVEDRPSWGYLCGREPDARAMRVNPRGRLFKKRQRLWLEAGRGIEVSERAPVVGLPQALSFYNYLPLWRRFFNRLGCRVKLSGATTHEIRELGKRMSGAEFCFPAKVFLGHAASLALAEGVDFLFLPQMKNEVPNEHVATSTFCPYVQATPAYTRAAFQLNGLDTARILSPIVDMRLSPRKLVDELTAALAQPLGVGWWRIYAAWSDAYRVQREFEQRVRDAGAEAITEARRRGEKIMIAVGRPYNLYDTGLNLGLPGKLADQGRTVVPLDALEIDLARLIPLHRNTFWNQGQKILAALEEVAGDERMDAVYFSNFSCGPDSFLLSYASEILGDKPFLTLELDEHGSNTGYLTRLESFGDVLRQPHRERVVRRRAQPPPADFRDRTLWVPNMHPYTTALVAAALRAEGYRARALPLETAESFELGRSVTRGSECLPMALTVGSLLRVLRASAGAERHAFFMPSAQGPCRFGEYVALHRQILDREGFRDVPIMTPSHFKGFAGLEEPLRRSLWKGMVTGDILMKAGCKLRPYEREPGATDDVLAAETVRLSQAIEEHDDLEEAVRHAIVRLEAVPRREGPRRPLVGIVGEIYVRNNLFANEDVVRVVERIGGEAWMAPLAEWVLFASSLRNVRGHHGLKFSADLIATYLKWVWMLHWEKRLCESASPLLDDRHEPPLEDVLRNAECYLPDSVGGEALLTIGRAVSFARQGAVTVVNVSPFGCMPGNVATALFRRASADAGLPIVNLFYDGTGSQNGRLEVYLRAAMSSRAPKKERAAAV